MNQLINLDGHVVFSKYSILNKICRELFFQSPVRYFAFQRFGSDGFYTLLASDLSLVNCFFTEENNFQNAWLFNSPFASFRSGIIFWDLVKGFGEPAHQKMSQKIEMNIKLGHGIDIVEKHKHYCDFYSFAGSTFDVYQCSIPWLRKFILYFKQECHHLINTAWGEKIYIPMKNQKLKLPIMNANDEMIDDKSNEFNIKRFYLQEFGNQIYLTSKELVCLKELAKGSSAKQAARILEINHRTVEHYVDQVKKKLDCSSIIEALSIARRNNLIE